MGSPLLVTTNLLLLIKQKVQKYLDQCSGGQGVVACDDQMEQQTQIMQQQLFSQQRQEQEQRQADYRADINAQEQIRQERNNAGWTNAILLDGQAK